MIKQSVSTQIMSVVYVQHFNPCYCVPLAFRVRSLWIPSRKCVPFINMHNGRVHDNVYCYNLGFPHTNEVSSYLGKNGFLHTNKRRSSTIQTIRLPGLVRNSEPLWPYEKSIMCLK